jgi:hypothetical protein
LLGSSKSCAVCLNRVHRWAKAGQNVETVVVAVSRGHDTRRVVGDGDRRIRHHRAALVLYDTSHLSGIARLAERAASNSQKNGAA